METKDTKVSKEANIPQVSQKSRSSKKWVLTLIIVLVVFICAGSVVFAWLGGYAKAALCKSVMPDSVIYNKIQCAVSTNVSNTQSQYPLLTVTPSSSSNQSAVNQQSASESVIQNQGSGVVGIGVTGDNTTPDQIIGTGFLVSQSGLIVTNRHVIENTQYNYYVMFKDATSPVAITSSDITSDPVNDIALIKVWTEIKFRPLLKQFRLVIQIIYK